MDKKTYRSDFLVAQPSWLSGMARLFDFTGTFDDYNESPNPSIADARALNNDWNVTLQDFKEAVHESQVKLGHVES